MNNYCRNCGEKLEKDVKVCPKCSAEVFEDRINVDNKKEEIEKFSAKENLYIVLIITLYVLSYVVTRVESFSDMSSWLFLAATIMLVYSRITMHRSKKIKILFGICVSIVVLYLLFILIMFMACVGAFERGCS